MVSTYAFLVAPLHGHVNPTLPVARELMDRGHRVVYWLPEEFRGPVASTGAAFLPYEPSPTSGWLQADDPLRRFAMIPVWLAAESVDVLPQVLDGVRAERPDVVVYDVLCVWGRLVAQLLALPAAMLCTSYAMNERFSLFTSPQYRALPRLPEAADRFLGSARQLHAAYGVTVDLLGLFLHREPLTIVFTTRSFHPASETFDQRYRFVGPSIGPAPHAVDPFLAELAQRPTVYVSMGTVFNDWPELLPACCAAFDDDRWQVVVATGGQPVPPGAPASVVVRSSVPQVDLLARSDVFVTHGGMNSVMEALHHGVPLVVIPQTPEQAITAARVAELGLGVQLPRASTTAGTLRLAVDRVTGYEAIRAAVTRMRAQAAAAGGYRAGADALEEFAGRG